MICETLARRHVASWTSCACTVHTLKSLKGRIDADDGCIRDRSPDRTPRGAANAMHAIEKA